MIEETHFLNGYIAEFLDVNGTKEKTVMIVQVFQPQDANKLTRIMYLESNGKVGRNSIGNTQFLVLPMEDQIKQFNECFYKYVPAPAHLKDHVENPDKKV